MKFANSVDSFQRAAQTLHNITWFIYFSKRRSNSFSFNYILYTGKIQWHFIERHVLTYCKYSTNQIISIEQQINGMIKKIQK